MEERTMKYERGMLVLEVKTKTSKVSQLQLFYVLLTSVLYSIISLIINVTSLQKRNFVNITFNFNQICDN